MHEKKSHKVANIWHCAKCDGEFPKCDYRYILKVELEDVYGHMYGFIYLDEATNQLMVVSAKDICLLSTEPTSLAEIAHNICNKQFLFTL